MKTLVLGLGNPVLTDDGVGWHVTQQLAARFSGCDGVEVRESCLGGLSLMEELVGYDAAVIVDAVCSGAPPGTVHDLHVGDLPTQHSASAHDASLPLALRFGRDAGAHLPSDDYIQLIGVEAEDVTTFSEECTPHVRAAIPAAAEATARAIALLRGTARIDKEAMNP